jgi:hypothetical protein
MPVPNIANISLAPGVDQTGHSQACVDILYTDAEGFFGEAGKVYAGAVQVFAHGNAKFAISLGNCADPAKAIFEQDASAQTVPANKILVR